LSDVRVKEIRENEKLHTKNENGKNVMTTTIKYNLTVLMVIAMVLVGCSKEDFPDTEQQVGQLQQGTQHNVEPIVLGVKEVVPPVTRAQHTGSMNFTQLESTGFGVYGYEGDAAYNSSTTAFELFAPNTHVTFVSGGTEPTTIVDHPGNWEYSGDLKPWTVGKKYTFFAYAPFMSAGEGTQGVDAGINTISTGAGDPTIGYTVATDPAESVDLLWGVRTDTKEKAGLAWVDIEKGQTTSDVLFTFYHALCAVGLHAQVMVDQANDTDNLGDLSQLGTIGSADGCKVTLKSITITPAGFPDAEPVVAATLFTKSAQLNLNNTTKHQPRWQSHTGTIASLVVDGTKLDDELKDPTPNDVSDYSVMTSESYDTEVPGITESANTQTVIKNDKLFMLIPQAAQDYTVSVEYFLTYKTESGYHREEKSGTAKIRNLELAAGVKYYLNLVFGLTTFKLSVDATDWQGQNINTSVVIENGTSASESLVKKRRMME
jgi:hypothetical protein